jgi:Uma2 family endonuclease
MIAQIQQSLSWTASDYLAWEEQQDVRYEFVCGEIYAMTGGTINHSEIANKFSALLFIQMENKGCRVLNSDAKVEVAESELYLYPDISITCNPRDRSASKFISHPCLIVEVLSPSTEAYDRGDKFALYRRSPSLQEYVLVNTKTPRVEVYRRREQGRWELMVYGVGEEVYLESIDCSCEVDRIFANIIFG